MGVSFGKGQLGNMSANLDIVKQRTEPGYAQQKVHNGLNSAMDTIQYNNTTGGNI